MGKFTNIIHYPTNRIYAATHQYNGLRLHTRPPIDINRSSLNKIITHTELTDIRKHRIHNYQHYRSRTGLVRNNHQYISIKSLQN